jgi:hypothetical protein
MWIDDLKKANVSVHLIATGAGAGLQQQLWETPGSSAYLSGCHFPYAMEEQEELLGFMPEHFVSEENAVDLASAAYMKAYRFGGKKPIGIGITASVASEKIHRGEHRIFICTISDNGIKLFHRTLEKGMGIAQRIQDGQDCDAWGKWMLQDAAKIISFSNAQDATELARKRFFGRPFFAANGKRLATLPKSKHLAMMPGAYNPPHEGHLSTAQHVLDDYNQTVVYEVTAEPPHKEPLSVQALLQRAKLLQGHDRLFTKSNPLYLDKANAYPGVPLVLGADAMVRMLDPKWGIKLNDLFVKFDRLQTKLLVSGRLIGDKFITCDDILNDLKDKDYNLWNLASHVMRPVSGRVDISSTELRNQTKLI